MSVSCSLRWVWDIPSTVVSHVGVCIKRQLILGDGILKFLSSVLFVWMKHGSVTPD